MNLVTHPKAIPYYKKKKSKNTAKTHKMQKIHKPTNFKHKKTGKVICQNCFNRVPASQKQHFYTTNEHVTHHLPSSVNVTDNTDGDNDAIGNFLMIAAAEALMDSGNQGYDNAPQSDNSTTFGGGDTGGGGAGNSYSTPDPTPDSSSGSDYSTPDSTTCDNSF